jgi:hypothetical protein
VDVLPQHKSASPVAPSDESVISFLVEQLILCGSLAYLEHDPRMRDRENVKPGHIVCMVTKSHHLMK